MDWSEQGQAREVRAVGDGFMRSGFMTALKGYSGTVSVPRAGEALEPAQPSFLGGKGKNKSWERDTARNRLGPRCHNLRSGRKALLHVTWK